MSTCAEVDVTSVRLTAVVVLLADAKLLRQAVLESASWLGLVVEEAVHICKVNASAALSARPTMSPAVLTTMLLLELAARVASHARHDADGRRDGVPFFGVQQSTRLLRRAAAKRHARGAHAQALVLACSRGPRAPERARLAHAVGFEIKQRYRFTPNCAPEFRARAAG